MDDNELSTLIHSLADIARRDRDELARSMRSRIYEIDRYADAVEQALGEYKQLQIEKPGELVLPMTEDEQRRIHAALEKAANDLERIRFNARQGLTNYRRSKYEPPDDCPF